MGRNTVQSLQTSYRRIRHRCSIANFRMLLPLVRQMQSNRAGDTQMIGHKERATAMLRAFDGKLAWVTPVRQEDGYCRSRREGWDQSWYEQSEIPEWIQLVSGWKPDNNRLDGEQPHPIPIALKADYANNCIESVGSITWNSLPAGTYHKVYVRNSNGELLWEIAISPSPLMTNAGDSLTITSVFARLSW